MSWIHQEIVSDCQTCPDLHKQKNYSGHRSVQIQHKDGHGKKHFVADIGQHDPVFAPELYLL